MTNKYAIALAAAAALVSLSAATRAAVIETTPGDGDIHLIYAPSTGNLTIAVNGNAYGTVTLASTVPGKFSVGVFGTSPEFYEGDVGTDLSFGVLTGQQTADVTLPAVLLTNQSEASLLSAITVVSDTQGPATSKFSFSGGLIPEPASLAAIAGLGGVGLIRRRRGA